MRRSTDRIAVRNRVRLVGRGVRPMVFAHGYGCDQHVWRLLAPAFEHDHRVLLYDLTGLGRSDLRAYDHARHGSLRGHAEDLLEILDAFAEGPVVFVGHSVSAMIGLLAGVHERERFAAHVMVAPSPRFINDANYVGGFTPSDIEALVDTLDRNYLGWATAMAPVIMGAPDQPELARELTHRFCTTDPQIARHFARVTFLSDCRAELPKLQTPTLILQCSDDVLAPLDVGRYMHAQLPRSELRVIDNVGHCPHLSAPAAVGDAMREFLC